ncbi:MAG: BlaI/MecI/CopY family transcriptional regulator [Lachnospiraceae bacterium]|nr:BlaI/MecI/CopY family transcriptional regulator [Lachnospiraceae bacterium]
MRPIYHLPESEREVMEMLWKFPQGIKQSALLECLNEVGKDWKRQTVNTFITRLEEKGLVRRENRIVWAAMGKEAFSNLEVEDVVENVYGGMFSKLVLAFAKEKKLTKEDAEQLKRIMEAYQDGED